MCWIRDGFDVCVLERALYFDSCWWHTSHRACIPCAGGLPCHKKPHISPFSKTKENNSYKSSQLISLMYATFSRKKISYPRNIQYRIVSIFSKYRFLSLLSSCKGSYHGFCSLYWDKHPFRAVPGCVQYLPSVLQMNLICITAEIIVSLKSLAQIPLT